MTSITISDLLTIIFVLVDDWYQAYGSKLLVGKVGKKPVFRDYACFGAGFHSLSRRDAIFGVYASQLPAIVSETSRSKPV